MNVTFNYHTHTAWCDGRDTPEADGRRDALGEPFHDRTRRHEK